MAEVDIIPITDDSEAMEAARKEAEAVEAQIKLFQGLKFFIGREVRYPPPLSFSLPVMFFL